MVSGIGVNKSHEQSVMLHVGCGTIRFDGWVNIDIETKEADLIHDLRTPLPFDNESADLIYHEHFIEHLNVTEGVAFFKDCHRVLKNGGVMRIATPDLDYVMRKYFFFWRSQDWIKYHYSWLKTKAEMMNLCFTEWGHKYLYNKEELVRRLKESGFSRIKRYPFGKSVNKYLRNRESRKDSKLIIEATK